MTAVMEDLMQPFLVKQIKLIMKKVIMLLLLLTKEVIEIIDL